MSTLAEIEAAVAALPRVQQEELFHSLARRIGREETTSTVAEDPFAQVIGGVAGPVAATGRAAEEILYGRER